MIDTNNVREKFLDEYGQRKKEETRLEIVRTLLLSGSTLEYTSFVTKMSLETIEQIDSELKNDPEAR